MKKEEIHFLDWERWLFGQEPPEFMLEVAIRTILIYFILIAAARLMGKRMKGQITVTELAVMITLGAIVSPVMQLPDRGLVFAIIALCIAILFQRGITLLEFRSRKAETLTQGQASLVMQDGTLVLAELEKADISKQQLYAMLREKKIANLGNVKRAYLEACGMLSVYRDEGEKAGLPIFPPADPDIRQILPPVDHAIMACCNCGNVQEVKGGDTPCSQCGASDWGKAHLSAGK